MQSDPHQHKSFFEELLTFNKKSLRTKVFGFVFDTTEVTDQYAACLSVMGKYYRLLMFGL